MKPLSSRSESRGYLRILTPFAAGLLIGCGNDDEGANFPSVTDFSQAGPFTTTQSAEGPACTIFRPDPLGENGQRHPVIIWGNGTLASPLVYAPALTHWATHGFVVAAADTSNAGSGTEMIACLDYVLQQNEASGTVYFENIDPDHVGASGHSQGGGGSIMAGRDPRVTVTAPLQPYVLLGLGGFQTSSIGEQQGPMFLMSGSADTIATPADNQQPVYDGVNVPVFWGTLEGADHIASAIGDITGYRGPATAWFRLHLMSDQSARDVFYGSSCELCTDPSWTVQRKAIE